MIESFLCPRPVWPFLWNLSFGTCKTKDFLFSLSVTTLSFLNFHFLGLGFWAPSLFFSVLFFVRCSTHNRQPSTTSLILIFGPKLRILLFIFRNYFFFIFCNSSDIIFFHLSRSDQDLEMDVYDPCFISWEII